MTRGSWDRSGALWHRPWDTADPYGHAQEGGMSQYSIRRWVFVSLLGGMFVLGFVSGSVSQRPAQAQVPGLGGALGSVKELGSSIVEMQQHVDGLQKNLATLKKVEAALGVGK